MHSQQDFERVAEPVVEPVVDSTAGPIALRDVEFCVVDLETN